MSRLDAAAARRYYRAIPNVAITATLTVGLLAACSARRSAIAPPTANRLAARVIDATAPRRPLRIEFEWRLRERSARFSGRGVARMAPPYRLRLDLFGPRGGTVMSAAMVGGDLRLAPVAAGAAIVIPPAALLWSAVGVFRPPQRADRIEAVRENGAARLRYDDPRGEWSFVLADDRVREASFRPAAGGQHTVRMNGIGPYGVAMHVVYRDYAAFRELELTVERVDESEPFPAEVWIPAR